MLQNGSPETNLQGLQGGFTLGIDTKTTGEVSGNDCVLRGHNYLVKVEEHWLNMGRKHHLKPTGCSSIRPDQPSLSWTEKQNCSFIITTSARV